MKTIDKRSKFRRVEDVDVNRQLLFVSILENFGSPGIVVDPEVAKSTACTCYKVDGKFMCYSKGIIGTLKHPGQVEAYCPTILEKESPALQKRIKSFREAAAEAHKEIEGIPKGERLDPWLRAMSKELRERGIEI